MNIVTLILLILFSVSPVKAFTYDGVNVNLSGESIVINGQEGVMEVTEDNIKLESEEGLVVIGDKDISINATEGEKIAISEDSLNMMDWSEKFVLTEEAIIVDDGSDFNAIVIKGGEIGLKVEEPGTVSNLTMISTDGNKMILSDGQDEYEVQIGSTGIKVTDADSSVVIYYGESGIQTSNILIGDQTGTIYLATDFGEKKIGAMPNKMVKQLTHARKLKPTRLEFGWDMEGTELFYVIVAGKVENFLWLAPTTINETNYYSTVSGVLMETEKSAWNMVVDWMSF